MNEKTLNSLIGMRSYQGDDGSQRQSGKQERTFMITCGARFLILASTFVASAISAAPSANAESKLDGRRTAVLVTATNDSL